MKASQSYRDYRDDPALSPSDIKLFGKDVQAFYKYKLQRQQVEEKKSAALIIGDLVDLMLTQSSDLDKIYYINTSWKATEKVKDIVDHAWKLRLQKVKEGENNPDIIVDEDDISMLSLDDNDIYDLVIDGINTIGYYPGWTMLKRYETIVDKGKDYWEQLKEANGKEMVDIKIYNKAVQALERARKDRNIGEFIQRVEGTLQVEGREIKTQMALYGHYQGSRIKGLLDVADIDHIERTVTPIDVKTCRYLQMFQKNAKMSRYDVQGDLYSYILEQIVSFSDSPYYGYSVNPFKFLVIPIEGEQQPEWIQLDEKDMHIARAGHDAGPGVHIFGWTESIADINWHKDNNLWEHHKSYYENGMCNKVDLWRSTVEVPDEVEMEESDLF